MNRTRLVFAAIMLAMLGSHPHGSRGCSQDDLRGTGGDGLFYCFAIN